MLVPGAALAATGSLAGTVTDAATDLAIEGARVCAWSTGEETEDCAHTATDGSYLIGGLKPGGYTVEFRASGYARQFWNGKGSWSEAETVEVVESTTSGAVDAALQPTATIEGTVTATEDGLGVEEVEVCAYPVSAAEENFWECGYTESDGSYSIGELNPGNYKVEFWTGFSVRNLAYQFWDHKARYAEADVIALAEGEDKTGIDAELEPGASIAGSVLTTTGAPLEARVCAIDAGTGKLTVCTWTDEAGNYGLDRLAADDYKVVFSPEFWEFFPGEGTPGEEDDGLPTQFWNNQTTLAAANVLSLGAGSSAGAIDARYAPLVRTPPLVVPPTVTPPARKHRKCPRGKKKRRIHGKVRCVRVHKRHRHRHHGSGGGAPRLLRP
ncbi:MAG TPA: carboxypeptidase-like regulatory domain-containing protein [Solirubrobacterales bacterium]|nr:carboxypeptidase-like regulatory domain-containing protein [Solirubrobacterales bacterium]